SQHRALCPRLAAGITQRTELQVSSSLHYLRYAKRTCSLRILGCTFFLFNAGLRVPLVLRRWRGWRALWWGDLRVFCRCGGQAGRYGLVVLARCGWVAGGFGGAFWRVAPRGGVPVAIDKLALRPPAQGEYCETYDGAQDKT